MRFETASELRLFAETVRAAVAQWEAPREPAFGEWWDEHDDELAARLAEAGWAGLWTDGELLGAAVAGAQELGRVAAPLSLVDDATLGGALCIAGRARHATASHRVASVGADGVTLAAPGVLRPEPTLDGSGTVLVEVAPGAPELDSDARLHAWTAATLGYLAGLAGGALEETVAYVSSREQFGAPLASLPAMQARLADAALLVDGLVLVAWEAAALEAAVAPGPLAWAGTAAREVTAIAHQAHGGVGFALESGVHVRYRRAKTAQVWAGAVLAAVRAPAATRPPR